MLAALVPLLLCVALPRLQLADDLESLAAAGRWETLRAQVEARLLVDDSDSEARYWFGREQLAEAWGLLSGDRVARDIGRSVLERAVVQLTIARDGGVAAAADWLLQARFTRWQLALPGEAATAGELLAADLEDQWSRESRPMAASLRGAMARLRADDPALPWLERAARAAPRRSAYALDWSRELAASGDRDGAVAAWKTARAAPDWEPADLLATLLVAMPSSADAARRLELLDELLSDPRLADDALLAWHRAHAFAALDRPELAAAAFDAGTSGRTAQIDRAAAVYLRAVERIPEALELLFARARERHWDCLDDAVTIADGLAIAGRFSEALAAYETALSIEPRHELALWHRALATWHSGRDAEAAVAWAELIERFPGRSDIVNDGALAAWGVGDHALARRRLELAATWPGSEDARENLAVLLLQSTPAEEGRAWDLLDSVLQADPQRDRSLLYRYRSRCHAVARGR